MQFIPKIKAKRVASLNVWSLNRVFRRGFKGSVFEGGIRMPAIVRWPGKVKPGSVTDELAATYDIFTTVSSIRSNICAISNLWYGLL